MPQTYEDYKKEVTENRSPTKAIRLKCLDCAGSRKMVNLCASATTCALHPFRMGKNPFSKRGAKVSAEVQAQRAVRCKTLNKKANKDATNNTVETK